MLYLVSPFRMPFGFVLTILLSVFVGVGPVGATPVDADTSDAPRGTATSYVEMQNVTGRRNVTDTHTVEDVTHWGRFFVGGVKVEV